MTKQSRRKLRRPKRKSYKKKTMRMVGGAFTQEETQKLLALGFTENDVKILADTRVGLNIIEISLNQINPATGANFTPQELIQSVNEAKQEIDNIDYSQDSSIASQDSSIASQDSSIASQDSSIASLDSLRPSDLDISQDSNLSQDSSSTNTTKDDSVGGRKRKSYRKTRKIKNVRKHVRKSRKQRGGMCFGNGIGSNNYDPSLSVYNTRELTLFPYRPTPTN